MMISLNCLFWWDWKKLFLGVDFTVSLVTPLVVGLFWPFKDQNYSTDYALSGWLFRSIRCLADGPPEAIVSPISSNSLLYTVWCVALWQFPCNYASCFLDLTKSSCPSENVDVDSVLYCLGGSCGCGERFVHRCAMVFCPDLVVEFFKIMLEKVPLFWPALPS